MYEVILKDCFNQDVYCVQATHDLHSIELSRDSTLHKVSFKIILTICFPLQTFKTFTHRFEFCQAQFQLASLVTS